MAGVTDQRNLFVFPGDAQTGKADGSGHGIRKFKCDLVRSTNCDILYYPTFFDGFYDRRINTDIAESAGVLNIATLYDLIPFHNLDNYPSEFVDFYVNKIVDIMRMDAIFCISNHAATEIQNILGIHKEKVHFVGADTSNAFFMMKNCETIQHKIKYYNIFKPFFMYVSAISMHKNHEMLLFALSQVDPHIRSRYQLALIGPFTQSHLLYIENMKQKFGLAQDVVSIPSPTDTELNVIYNISSGTIFPSRQEGFGLPVLEAMRCGKSVIASSIPSIREILERDDCLFDPHSAVDMTRAITRFFVDDDWRRDLATYNADRAHFFSWSKVIGRVMEGFETVRDHRS